MLSVCPDLYTSSTKQHNLSKKHTVYVTHKMNVPWLHWRSFNIVISIRKTGQTLFMYHRAGCNLFSCNKPWSKVINYIYWLDSKRGSMQIPNVLIIKYRQDCECECFFLYEKHCVHKSNFYAQLLCKMFHMEPKGALLPSPSALLSSPTSHLLLQQVPYKASWNIPVVTPPRLPPLTRSWAQKLFHCVSLPPHTPADTPWHPAYDRTEKG